MSRNSDAGVLVPIAADRTSGAPLHVSIANGLREAVEAGRLPVGTRLPSTRTLAKDWGVSRNTVLQVFEALTAEGYLEGRVGAGTYVAAAAGPAIVPEPQHDARSRDPRPTVRPSYPFRSLSQRGRVLIAQSFDGLAEKPAAFTPDVPDLRAFPIRSWLRVMNEVAGRLTGEVLVNVSNAGYGPLREAIAQHLRITREIVCRPEQIIITTGSQQSLDLVARLLLERGDPVWMEDPGYVGSRATLVANGCAVMPVPADADGMNVEEGIRRFPAPRLVLVSPTRGYPLGGRLSRARREALLGFACRSGAWVLEDDYDSDFRYGGPPQRPLQVDDGEGRVVLMGTFSKTLLPSFRLGWILAPVDLAADFAKARAVIDRHAPLLEQMVLAEFMHRGLYAAHLRRMRELYRARQAALASALEETLGWSPPAPEREGGMHVVLPLADGTDDRAVAHDLAEAGVMARPLSMYYAGRARRSGLLLGYAAYDEDEIRRAAHKLAALRDVVRTDGSERASARLGGGNGAPTSSSPTGTPEHRSASPP